MHKILLPTRLPDAVMEALSETYDVTAPLGDENYSVAEVIARLPGNEVFCPLFYTPVKKEILDALPKSLKLIASFGIGTDHIDIDAAHGAGLVISNTPDVGTRDTADLTIGLLIATCRRFYEREIELREGRWPQARLLHGLGASLFNKTLGIIGLGSVGEAVIRRATVFDMTIVYHSRTRKKSLEAELGLRYMDTANDLLDIADFVCLHATLTSKTHHLIDALALKRMKNTAYLINTGRGALIDENALVRALRSGEIAGAGLDVYEFEPKMVKGLKGLENVTLLPHMGTATLETREAQGFRMKANMDRFFATGQVVDPVVP
jgi:glyoxylate reductase